MENNFLKPNKLSFSQFVTSQNRQQLRTWLPILAAILFSIGLIMPYWSEHSLLLDSAHEMNYLQSFILFFAPSICLLLWISLLYLPESNGYNILFLLIVNSLLSCLHAVMMTHSITLAPISVIVLTALVKVMILRTWQIIVIYGIGLITALVIVNTYHDNMVISWSLYISFSLAFLWLFYLGHDHRHRSQEAFEYEKKLWKAKKQITLQLMELESQTHQLQKLVKIDALTGLYNRRTFDSELKKELLRASRAQSSLSLLIVDIDHFKQVNDQLGHKKGDEYLSKVAQTLKTICLRQTDMVSRYGGEEFALLLPGTDKKGLEVLAQNLNDAILDLQLPHPNGKAVTISIGGAEYQPRHMAGDDLFNLADQALYKVKASGRNHYLIQ